MNPSEKHILEIDSVELSFGDRVILSSVYLAVETGGATALLGRNGSGKSCLMKILCGALRPGFRSMRIDGKWYDRFGSSQVRYLPQQGFTPGWLTVEAVLRDFGLEWDDLTVWFPIFGKLRKAKIRTLSGGERRILECFVILRSRSLFAVLDEPFSQVAPLHVVTLKALIRAEKRNKGILLTDHMYRHVTDVADRLYVLANGQTYLTQGGRRPCALRLFEPFVVLTGGLSCCRSFR
ncbi:ATP-binding cassette domain-containing protein [Alistipes putredinis]|uniref:ATP-binding cassette domain-containing protein n=1 Tax=Alistipes putredinis TaxID=28117 RepID=UPI003AB29921